jgi:hypothetical protein
MCKGEGGLGSAAPATSNLRPNDNNDAIQPTTTTTPKDAGRGAEIVEIRRISLDLVTLRPHVYEGTVSPSPVGALIPWKDT